MTRSEQAKQIFDDGNNCSQAVLAVYAEELGLTQDQAYQVASGFGGGSFVGGTCGAVTGAFMVLGLKYGGPKQKPYEKVKQFSERFEAKHGSLMCLDLLGGDIRDEQVRQWAQNKGVYDRVCAKLVMDAVEILEEMM